MTFCFVFFGYWVIQKKMLLFFINEKANEVASFLHYGWFLQKVEKDFN